MSNAPRRQPFQIGSIAIDHIHMALPFSCRTEHQMTAVRRPGGRIVDSRARGESNALLPIGTHEAQLVLTLFGTAHMGNPVSTRRPGRRGIIIALISQTPYIGTVRAHHEELRDIGERERAKRETRCGEHRVGAVSIVRGSARSLDADARRS